MVLAACGESGPTEEEQQAAKDERSKATRLAGQAESAADLAAGCRQAVGPLINALRNTSSRLNVGLTFDDYSDQVGEVSIAYGRIPFNRMELRCISDAGLKAEKAFNSYTEAYNDWNDCIADLYCDIDSIDPGLQEKWQAAERQLRQARAGLAGLELEAAEAEERSEKQEKKAVEAEAALEA